MLNYRVRGLHFRAGKFASNLLIQTDFYTEIKCKIRRWSFDPIKDDFCKIFSFIPVLLFIHDICLSKVDRLIFPCLSKYILIKPFSHS